MFLYFLESPAFQGLNQSFVLYVLVEALCLHVKDLYNFYCRYIIYHSKPEVQLCGKSLTILVKCAAIPTLSPVYNNVSDSIAYLWHTINNRSSNQIYLLLNNISRKFYSETLQRQNAVV